MSGSKANLSIGSTHGATSDQRWHLHHRQLERIQNKLEEFLSPIDARETAISVYDLVLEVDDEIDRILRDSLVRKFYEYDGRFFTPKCNWGFYRAFDGIHILRSLNDATLETFFRGRDRYFAIRWLLDELEKHVWEAKVRRMNWEESGTLSVISKDVLDEILRNIRHREKADEEEETTLSPEERAFFQSFEDQMASRE
jgi:hypothetical protein